jgi:hypothetical protein
LCRFVDAGDWLYRGCDETQTPPRQSASSVEAWTTAVHAEGMVFLASERDHEGEGRG